MTPATPLPPWSAFSLPEDLRVPPPAGVGEHELADFVRALLAEAARPPVVPPPAPPAELPPGFALELCNLLFKMQRQSRKLAARDACAGEAKRVADLLTRVDELLRDHGIEWRDPTGEPYQDQRLDFESVGPAEREAGLAHPIIRQCEQPSVMIGGRLAQAARGIAALPG